jgi:hypothetical protein
MPDDPKELREKAVALELQAKAAEALAAQQTEALPPATETPAAAAPATPEIPAAPMVPAPVADAAAQRGPQPPAGKAPLRTIDEWEALPKDERQARMDEVDALILEGQS